jgi:expansin (peptidoglycan-binding protein)
MSLALSLGGCGSGSPDGANGPVNPGGTGGSGGGGDGYHLVRLGQAAWIAVHVRNPAIGVARVDVLAQGRWARLRRAAVGVFAAPTAVGGGPFVFRVMDVHGHTAVDRGVPLVESQETAGANRLSMCAP